jgi:holo-[acyl-carrier protein] synthase
MIVLVGIDIQPIDEVEASLRIFGARYSGLIFTDHEVQSCARSLKTASEFAARFAAKEAVLKILDTRKLVPAWRSIEVKCCANGHPGIMLYDSAAQLAREQGIHDFAVALSFAGAVAAATVVAKGLAGE